mgnify:CR=1 FL=1
MTQGKHFAAGGDHFAALPSKKIHAPKGIARLTVTAATMAAMTGSSLISPFTAFAQTGDGGSQHPAVMSPIAAHAGAASGTGAKSAAQTIADLQKAVDEAKAKEDAAKASYDEAAGPYNEAASARDQAKASYDSAVSAGAAADRAAMDEYARQVAEGKDAADAAGKDLEQAKAGLADAKADASEKDEAYQSALKAAQDAKDALDKAKADAVGATPEAIRDAEQTVRDATDAVSRAQAELDNANATLADAQSKLVAAQSAKDSADTVLAAAQQNKDTADAKAAAASAAYEQAKADLAAAEAGASGPEYDAAKQKVADAEATLAAAQAAQSQCESELEQVQSAAATAQTELNDAQASLSAKQQAAVDAASGVNDAQSALDAANSDLDAAKQANADAIAKLDAAKQAVKDAESAKAAADEELANAKTAKDTADAAVTAAQQKVDEAQAKLDSADAQLKQGAIGFFRAMGADDAVNIILNAKYVGKTEVGNSKDATSLDNMLNAIRWMKSVNDYRKSVGLSELQVTYKLIAGAIADANYSDTVLDHARQYDFAENLAWNYGIDPSGQWIEQEKGFFDKATEALYGVTGLVGKDAYDFYAKNGVAINHWIADNCHWENGSSGTVGHYMNIINPELAVMGMATCTKGTMSGLQTQCYTAEISGWSGSGWNTNPISVDEYEQKLTSYINGLKNAKSALDVAKADLASKQQAAAGAAATVQQKQDAADFAQADVDAAKQDVTDAQRAVDAAKADVAAKQQGVTDAQTELDAAKSDLDAANAAVDTAKSTVQQKQVVFDAANAAVTTVQSKLDAAKADTSAKQQSVADANADLAKFFQDVADAKKALDTAKSVHDAAADQVEKATVLAAAEQKADTTARALADAQRAVDAAKADTGVAAGRLTGSQTDLEDAQSNLDILTGLAAKLAEAQQREQDAVKAVNDTKAALDAAKADTIVAESLVSAAEQAKALADAKLSKLNSIDAGAAIASGHDVNADDALNALFAAAVEARAKVAPAKAILDEKQAAVDEKQAGYDAALAAYELAKSDRIAAEQKLSDEIARQEAEEVTKQQTAYTPKHLAGTDTAQPGSLAQTGDRAGLIGETFVIGGTVLVAAGVFLDQKKRREQM